MTDAGPPEVFRFRSVEAGHRASASGSAPWPIPRPSPARSGSARRRSRGGGSRSSTSTPTRPTWPRPVRGGRFLDPAQELGRACFGVGLSCSLMATRSHFLSSRGRAAPHPPDGAPGDKSMPRLAARVAGAIALLGVIAGPLVARAAGIPRPEHPRPDAVRPHWSNLNGPWEFRFDPKDEGLKAALVRARRRRASTARSSSRSPGRASSRASSELEGPRRSRWYRRDVHGPRRLPRRTTGSGSGSGPSTGGPTSGSTARRSPSTRADTRRSRPTSPTPSSRASPPSSSSAPSTRPTPSLPTGKQVGWYTPTSGIWQTVWLESRPKALHRRLHDQDRRSTRRRRRSRSTLPGVPAGKSSSAIRRTTRPSDREAPTSASSRRSRSRRIAPDAPEPLADRGPVEPPSSGRPRRPTSTTSTLELQGARRHRSTR